jgi:hypothetical protein
MASDNPVGSLDLSGSVQKHRQREAVAAILADAKIVSD